MEDPHKEIFKHGNREWKYIPTQVMFRNAKNQEKTDEEKAERVKGLLAKEKEKRIRLKELGIEYEFPGYQGIVDAAAGGSKKKRRDSEESTSKKAKKVAEEEPKAKKSSRKSSAENIDEKPAKKSKSSKKSKK